MNVVPESWVVKILLSAMFVAPFTTFVVFFYKQFGIRSELFLCAWMTGTMAAFLIIGRIAGVLGSLNFAPLPLIAVMLLGVFVGGTSNLFYMQAIPLAPNPGLPLALFSANIPLAYVLSYVVSKMAPESFPPITFSWINFAGIFIIIAGVVLVTYRSH